MIKIVTPAISKSDSFPTTATTTEFLAREGGKFEIRLGGAFQGHAFKRDGMFVAEFGNGSQMLPTEPHTKTERDRAGNVVSSEPLPWGPFLKRVREALVGGAKPQTA